MHIQPNAPARFCASLPFGGTFIFRVYNKAVRTFKPKIKAKAYFGALFNLDRRDLIQACIAHFGSWEPECR